ncbi:MAG: tryptophan--tRNA ligase [Bdellovibrionales bacterium RIFOXYD1_FULL_44_7]|nr:MAG: tryptophan--tRNA ligase [Bdellovibrionales bacterium RIFOXYD1_FULL_44_7]
MVMNQKKKTMLSAVQPSNRLTLGNYIGALRNWVQLQQQYDCLFFAVNMHAITVRQDPKELADQTYRAIATYVAAGIDPDQATLFVQSHVPEHAQLSWILNCFTYMGELSRMTQFKDKSAKAGQNIGVGLFTYPVLMAADILLYDTNFVPVGEDQKQHLELTRDLAIRMNNVYGKDLFVVPEPYIPTVGGRIMSLQNPLVKMSKSDPDPNSAVYLNDSDDQIRKKVKRAVTDSGTEITLQDDKPGIKNLLTIQASLTGKKMDEIVRSYEGKQYGHLKVETAELVVQYLKPIRDKADELIKDKTFLDVLLKRGAQTARERAARTLARVFDRIGFIPDA